MSTPKKIITLLPSATEIVCALGLEHQLVGRSHECDYPETVKQLPACTEAKLTGGLSSKAIDDEVKQLLSNALSLYSVKKEQIKALQPDVIITQDQCAVCAVALPEVEDELKHYLEYPVQIISLKPNTIDDILANIATVAAALGADKAGSELVEELQERVDIIKHKLKFIEAKPTVACIEWLEPVMTSGNWIPGLVSMAGGNPVLAQAGAHSPYIDWDDIRLADPDIMVIMPCGFSVERTMSEIGVLLNRPGFNELKAVKNNRIYIADGNHYFNRPGPRIVDSLEIMAEIINPKQFVFGLEGTGWTKFSM